MENGPSLRRGAATYWLATCLAGALLPSCDINGVGPETCPRPASEEPKDYNGGEVIDGVYFSSPWDGPLLAFPGGEYLKLNHGLGTDALVWELYLAFSEDGTPGSVAHAAGNQAVVTEVAEDYVLVLNESCSDYHLLAVVWAPVGQVSTDED